MAFPVLPAGAAGRFTLLFAMSVVSLGLVSVIDNQAYRIVRAMYDHAGQTDYPHVLLCLVQARLTSCAMCALLAAIVAGRTTLHQEHRTSRTWRAAIVSGVWLIGTVFAIYVVRVYVPPLPRSVDVAAFMGFGLLAEELLFRGALFAIATAAFPTGGVAPIIWTAAFFSMQHLQYHHFRADHHALTQIAYTFPLGLVLGYVRSATLRLWPSVAVHFLNNGIAVLHGA